ncbi:MAG TPA: AAA family ATPase [Puia sp.]|nr:AAA family ATPase [Puia sp.]
MSPLKKIVVIGPESTGKSSLCEQLSLHFKQPWCPEFAREYLLKHGMNYNYPDLLTVAKGQIALEEAYTSMSLKDQKNHGPLLFIDTDMYVMKVWCEFVFNKCHQFILDQIASRKYDLYLLCNTDLPWVADELREYPDLETREKLFHIYKDILVNQDTAWVEIRGDYDERLNIGIDAVRKSLEHS